MGDARTCKTSESHLIFRVYPFCFVKSKKTLDLQFFSQIGKTTKMLLLIPNNIVNASALVIF